jgi:thioredoxin 1
MDSTDEFFERLQQNPRPVVVDFWASWCGPCKMIEPNLKKLGKEYEGRVDVWKVNADEHPDLLRKLHISGIPTLVGYNGGQEVSRRVGVAPYPVLNSLFESALSGEKTESPQAAAAAGMTTLDRVLRLAAAAALFYVAYSNGFAGWYLLAAVAGAVVAFSAIHDRCPIWQAIRPRLEALLGGGGKDQA